MVCSLLDIVLFSTKMLFSYFLHFMCCRFLKVFHNLIYVFWYIILKLGISLWCLTAKSELNYYCYLFSFMATLIKVNPSNLLHFHIVTFLTPSQISKQKFLFFSFLHIFFTRGQFWPSGIVVACVCLSVCPSVRPSACVCGKHLLVRAITHHPFKLGSPNLDHRCKRPWLRSL